MKKLTIAILLLLVASSSFAFEIDGFQNGMSKAKTKSLILDYKFDKVIDEDHSISAYDIPSKGTNRYFNFGFCKDKLVSVQKDYQPSMKNFILLAAELEKKYGDKVVIWPQPNQIESSGEKHSIQIYFHDKNDLVTLKYNIFDTNDQLSVTRESRNSCYKIPINLLPNAH